MGIDGQSSNSIHLIQINYIGKTERCCVIVKTESVNAELGASGYIFLNSRKNITYELQNELINILVDSYYLLQSTSLGLWYI